MDTKVVTPPERTLTVVPSRVAEPPAPQTDGAAKLDTAGSAYTPPVARADSSAPLALAQAGDPNAPKYVSPVIVIDIDTSTAVLQYRNPDTGKVVRQFPSKLPSDVYSEQARRLEEEAQRVRAEQGADRPRAKEVQLRPVEAAVAPKVSTTTPTDTVTPGQSTTPSPTQVSASSPVPKTSSVTAVA
ncbi:hypothetical protein [Roseiterribacter gracilis]|uniref:Uncharacterized protein n=1 Tax=Roseiterribacter gracilis TaxID=2812848 RepID=A0A8S8XFW1_9PROT|nr:hypothetical protein TMPK1_37110 [Rhodospirillales bacterium TMPK1]